MLAFGVSLFGWAAEPTQVAPQTPVPTGVIAGTVVDRSSGRAIPDATVTVTLRTPDRMTAALQRVVADPTGRFAFAGLPAGSLIIQAAKPGYQGADVYVELHEGERITNTVTTLTKYGSISGRITDDLGDPVIGVTVRAYRRQYEGGYPHFSYGTSVRTDDRGMYRIAFLEPGDYVVAVPATQISVPAPVMRDWMSGNGGNAIGGAMIDTTGMATFSTIDGAQRIRNSVLQSPIGTYYPPDSNDPSRGMAYQTVFAPSTTTTSAATVVPLQLGEQRTGVDVQLTLVPTVSVSGTVSGPEGPAPLAALRLMTPSSEFPDNPTYAAATTMSDASGAFTFLNVPAGAYVLRASKRPDQDGRQPPHLWGEESLAVGDKPIDGVRVALRKPFVISGRVVFEGASLPSTEEMSRIKGDQPLLFVESVGGFDQAGPGIEDATGSFTTHPLMPGSRYIFLSTIRSTRWSLKSVMWQGKDLTRTPIELKEDVSGVVATFTDRPGQIAGTVRSADGAPDKTATVLLFPVDAQAWTDYGDFPRQMLRAGPAITGTYSFPRVPAGDYFLIAVVESPAAATALDVPGLLRDWLNPAFLRAVSGAAVRVRVTDGESQTMDLKTAGIR